MARMQFDAQDVILHYPELKSFESDGSTDFNRIAAVIGSREADVVWGIHSALTTPRATRAQAERLAKLKAKAKVKS